MDEGDLLGGAQEDLEPIKDLAIEAGRKALSAAISIQAGPVAGLAAGVALAAALAVVRRRRRLAKTTVGEVEADVIAINKRLEELYARRRKLEEAMEAAKTRAQKRMISQAIRNTDSMIRDLEDMLELTMVLEEARLRVKTVLGPKAARELDKLLSRIEKGQLPSDDLYKILERINQKIDNTSNGIAFFTQLLGP